jgi:hypothetical protein
VAEVLFHSLLLLPLLLNSNDNSNTNNTTTEAKASERITTLSLPSSLRTRAGQQ